MLKNRLFRFLKLMFFRKKYLVGFLRQQFQKVIYYTDSINILWLSTKKKINVVLFYNLIGRCLFFCKEVVALLTGGRIFNKSIMLETYDEIDYAGMYKVGRHDIVWPKPPFAELEVPNLRNELYSEIAASYQVANDNDTEKLPRGNWWEKVSGQFREHFLLENGEIHIERLRNFRGERCSVADLIKDQLLITAEDGYMISYLRALDLVLKYHGLSRFVKNEILASLSDSPVGNSPCPVYKGKRLSNRLLVHAMYLQKILENVVLEREKKNIILEVGGGYGAFARLLKYYLPTSCYVIVELPEVAIFTSYFLTCCFPDAKIAFLSKIHDRLDNMADLYEEYDFIILPPWCMDKVPEKSVDLILNTTSMAEMSQEYGSYYLSNIERELCEGGYFCSVNRVDSKGEKYDDYGFFKWHFEQKYLTLSYESLPIGLPIWIGKKV